MVDANQLDKKRMEGSPRTGSPATKADDRGEFVGRTE